MRVVNHCDDCVYESDCYEHMIRLGEGRTYKCKKISCSHKANPQGARMEINETIMAALRLKSEIDAKKTELAKLNAQLAAMAQYKEGSQTGHIYTDAYHVKVSKRQNVKWNQNKLTMARAAIGDKEFFAVFGWKFEPKNKALLDNFFEQGQQAHADLIRDAMTVTEGAPGVSYEPLGE